jgi:hypothetical protein
MMSEQYKPTVSGFRTDTMGSDVLLHEIRQELKIPTHNDNYNYNHNLNKVKTYDYIFYFVYFALVLATSKFLVNFVHSGYVLTPFSLFSIIILSILLITTSIIRVDLRMNNNYRIPMPLRWRSNVFTLVQYTLSLLLMCGIIAFNLTIVGEIIVFKVLNIDLPIGVIAAFLTGLYFYISFLNHHPIKWYITGQPFWESTRNILNIPVASTKRVLAYYRLLIWICALSISSIPQIVAYNMILIYLMQFILVIFFLILIVNYIVKDIAFTKNLQFKIYSVSKLQNSVNLNQLNETLNMQQKQTTSSTSSNNAFDKTIQYNHSSNRNQMSDNPKTQSRYSSPTNSIPFYKSTHIGTPTYDFPESQEFSKEYLAKKSLFKIIDHVNKTRETEFENKRSQNFDSFHFNES